MSLQARVVYCSPKSSVQRFSSLAHSIGNCLPQYDYNHVIPINSVLGFIFYGIDLDACRGYFPSFVSYGFGWLCYGFTHILSLFTRNI